MMLFLLLLSSLLFILLYLRAISNAAYRMSCNESHKTVLQLTMLLDTLGQLSLASLRGRLIKYQLRLVLGRECHLCRVAGNTV